MLLNHNVLILGYRQRDRILNTFLCPSYTSPNEYTTIQQQLSGYKTSQENAGVSKEARSLIMARNACKVKSPDACTRIPRSFDSEPCLSTFHNCELHRILQLPHSSTFSHRVLLHTSSSHRHAPRCWKIAVFFASTNVRGKRSLLQPRWQLAPEAGQKSGLLPSAKARRVQGREIARKQEFLDGCWRMVLGKCVSPELKRGRLHILMKGGALECNILGKAKEKLGGKDCWWELGGEDTAPYMPLYWW